MIVGIDVSQLAYQNTGVANYLENLVLEMVKNKNYQFVLFFSSLRRPIPESLLKLATNANVRIVRKKFPPALLNLMWNQLHINPIEKFIGDVDIFITSDWAEPPVRRAKKATIIYDLIVYNHPNETDKRIVKTQKRKFSWVKKETDIIFCISESTKKDVLKIFQIDENKVKVIYPGLTL